jgi:hypothetical protein
MKDHGLHFLAKELQPCSFKIQDIQTHSNTFKVAAKRKAVQGER